MTNLSEFSMWEYKAQKEYIRECIHLVFLSEMMLPPLERPDNLEGVYRHMLEKTKRLMQLNGKDESWKSWDKFLDEASIKITEDQWKIIKMVVEEWVPLFPVGEAERIRSWKCLFARSRPCRVKTIADRLNMSKSSVEKALTEGYQTIIRHIIKQQQKQGEKR